MAGDIPRKEFESLRINSAEKRLYDFLAGKYLRLQSHQQFVRNFFHPAADCRTLHLMHATGCHAAGTPVMMWNGDICPIESVCAGDVLMGPDGGKRPVLGTVSGSEKMWRIMPEIGREWIVNGNHILYLYNEIAKNYVTMTVNQYVRLSPNHLYLPRASPDATRSHVRPHRAASLESPISESMVEESSAAVAISRLNRDISAEDRFNLLARGYMVENNIVYWPTRFAEDGRSIRSFTIRSAGRGRYYGITLGGDHLFLGGDMTIFHNTGKTLAAVGIAHEFARSYRTIFSAESAFLNSEIKNAATTDRATPSIFVLGYRGTKLAFIRELMRYPQLGFVSPAELDQLERMRAAGSIEPYKELFRQIRRRIGTKSRGGMYKFYGYDEFVNRLFPDAGSDYSTLTPEIISGVNRPLLESMRDSLLICDEIHHTYNMQSKNKRGLAIEYLLVQCPTLRFLSLSATLVNNRPAELVEILSYLHPGKQFPREEYFSSRRELQPGAENKLREAFRNKISFLQLADASRSPATISPPEAVTADGIPAYMKFIIVAPSDLQEIALQNLSKNDIEEENDGLDETENQTNTLPLDGQNIMDMIFPVPSGEGVAPMYRSGEIAEAIAGSSADWRASYGVSLLRTRVGMTPIFSGTCTQIDKAAPPLLSLADISAKYDCYIRYLLRAFSNSAGTKLLVYHPRIQGSGLLQIAEIMRQNGILEYGNEPVAGTRCGLCSRKLGEHDDAISCRFRAARFMMIHSDISPTAIVTLMAQFNSPENVRGNICDIMIGSRLIEESYDFKAVRHLVILSVPIHVGAIIQLIGRVVRTDSHALLPAEERNVAIAPIVTGKSESSAISLELQRYGEKFLDYQFVQKTLVFGAESAIDSDELSGANLKHDRKDPDLSAIKYNPTKNIIPDRPDTFLPRLHGIAESDLINYIIKRIIADPTRPSVWTYAGLFAAVKNPPFPVSVSPALFSESNFVIALHRLVKGRTRVTETSEAEISGTEIITRHLDPMDQKIWRGGVAGSIVPVGPYYIFTPFTPIDNGPNIGVSASEKYDENIRNRKLVAIYRSNNSTGDHLRPDVGQWAGTSTNSPRTFQLDQFLATISVENALVSARENLDKAGTFELDILQNYSSQVQIALIRLLLETEDKMPEWGPSLLEFYQKLGALILAAEVRNYPAISALCPKLKGKIAGYLSGSEAHIRAPGKWITVTRASLGRTMVPPENPIIVGLLEDQPGSGMKFKIRRPRTVLSGNGGDARLIERGVVCSIKGKSTLEGIIREIRPLIRTADMAICGKQVSASTGNSALQSLCRQIFGIIVALESRERLKVSQSHSYKYLYSWWDENQ